MKRRTAQQEIPALLERYELKYQIPVSMIGPISDYLSIYCSMDEYSVKSDDGFYTVNSLYLDSPQLLFLQRRMEDAESRFNLRIRSYGEAVAPPYFFEIKQKRDGVIRKYRVAVADESWPRMFEPGGYSLSGIKREADRANLDLFYRTVFSYQAEPKILMQYRRKAYISDVDDYARATFDVDLRFQDEPTFSLTPDNTRMAPCRNDTIFDPECSVILELKCYASMVPRWMLDLIRHFDLKRSGFSKYMTAALHVFAPTEAGRFDRVSSCNVISSASL